MDNLWQDLRYGLRVLAKSPGLTAVAVLTLTLGIGANSAIFSVVNAVLLRALPYDQSDRLVLLSERARNLDSMSVSYPNFQDWRDQNDVFEQLAVFRRQPYNLTGGAEPEVVIGGQVSAEMFTALRTDVMLGRAFLPEEDKPGGSRVVILTYGLWQRRFGGDAGILGQALTLSDAQYTVIGVMPQGFQFPSRVDLWLPVGQGAANPNWVRGNHPGLFGVARLKPGVTIERARAEMETIAVRLEQQYPESNTGDRVTINPLLEAVIGNIRPALLVLLGAVCFVLLIACANVANLLLARAATRQKEIAIRTALGAGRFRLIRQLLTESVLMSLIGGGLGLLAAKWGVKLIVAVNPNNIPRSQGIGVDGRVVAFTMALALLTGIVFGLAPALQASKPDLNETLKEAGRGSSGGLRRQRLRALLVISEVALALVLLICGGLMMRSFHSLSNVDPGFNIDHILTLSLRLPESKYKENAQIAGFFQDALERINALPGILCAGGATGFPLGNNGNQTSFTVEGRPEPAAGDRPLMEITNVSSSYFRALGIPLLRGRIFTDSDNKDAPRVIIIDDTFAKRYWPDEDPIGKQIRTGGNDRSESHVITVVGVAGRVKMETLDSDSNRVQAYSPYLQAAWSGFSILIHTAGEPLQLAAPVREQIRAVDADQAVSSVRTMEEIWDNSVAPQRMNLVLLAVFATLALLLSAVGIYGVMSYSVTQRTHEVGIRLALGARSTDVVALVVRNGMSLTLIGVGIGLIFAFALTRLMASLLFGISATDPLTFAAVSTVIGAVALVACYVPARRATRVDPIVALRYE